MPRSLRFYVAASTLYVAAVFLAVQYVYSIELAGNGIQIARRDNGEVLASIQIVSFAIWLGVSLIAAAVMYRLANALAGARSAEQRKDVELGSIFALSAALAGPLDLQQIGVRFVSAIRGALGEEVSIALIVYDDRLEAFRTVATDGPLGETLRGSAHTASSLPALIRTRVIDHRQPLVLPDTAETTEPWAKQATLLGAAAGARSFAALPLVSRERLVGALLLISAKAGALTHDRMQLPMMMGQYVAGSIHSALSVAEAEARAEREAAVNRIAQRARASLDPEEILKGTIEELGRVLAVSRALVCVGNSEDDLAVAHEWDAPGVPAVGVGSRHLPVSRLAARLGRTISVTDVRQDRRFAEPREQADLAPDVVSAAATPVRVAGHLAGALSLSQVGRAREWTAEDIRLIEAVAHELRAAITAAEAFERQRAAVAELERLNRAKSDFVSIVSHEFRTPLTGIQGFSEMMANEELSVDEMREYAGDINKDARRLNRLINEMLDLDRMESGRMQVHREPVDLNSIVADVTAQFRPTAAGHPISLHLDHEVGPLWGDRDRLTQVLTNLLSNAVKYSPRGGAIVVATRREGDSAHLLVRDHGMGIPADALRTIFERYGRVESRATRHIQGTGLGLPIVQQIVQLHGGTVWAESTVGAGSVFHVTLPLREAVGEAAS